MEEGLLTRIKEWISPLPTGGLVHERVRGEMYRQLARLDVHESDVVASGIGATVAALAQSPLETEPNRAVLRGVINKWMQLALGSTLSSRRDTESAEAVLEAARRRNVRPLILYRYNTH